MKETFRVNGVALGDSEEYLQQAGWSGADAPGTGGRFFLKDQALATTNADGRVVTVHGDQLSQGERPLLHSGQPVSDDRRELFQALELPPCEARELCFVTASPFVLWLPDWDMRIQLDAERRIQEIHALLAGRRRPLPPGTGPDELRLLIAQPVQSLPPKLGPAPESVLACTLQPGGELMLATVSLRGNPASEHHFRLCGLWPGHSAELAHRAGWEPESAPGRAARGFHTGPSHHSRAWCRIEENLVKVLAGPELSRDGRVLLARGQPVNAEWSEVFRALGLPQPEERLERSGFVPARVLAFVDWGLRIVAGESVVQFVLEGDPPVYDAPVRGYEVWHPPATPADYRCVRFR